MLRGSLFAMGEMVGKGCLHVCAIFAESSHDLRRTGFGQVIMFYTHTCTHAHTDTHTHIHTLTLHTVCAITESQQELDTIMGAKRAFNLTWLTLGKQLDQEPPSPLPHTLAADWPDSGDQCAAMWWSSQACNNRKRHANASNQWKWPLRHALHFIDSRLRETRDSSCDHLPSCASKANGAEAEAKASVGRLWRYLRHFHSIPFILPHLVAASLWKWKLPRNCKIPPHCVIFSPFASLSFCFLCSAHFVALCTVAYWAMEACHRPQHI